MEIIEATSKDFKNIIPDPYHIFGQSAFAELNNASVERMYFLLFRDNKYRLGITLGVKDNSLFSPFSAPFGGFVFIKEEIQINYIEEAVSVLNAWAIKKSLISINITLPPSIYNENFIAKQANVFFRYGMKINNVELNYAFQLDHFNEYYLFKNERSSRKNLKIALSNNLIFKECISYEEKKLAYDIICLNRKYRGFPLRMSWIQIEQTIKLIPADFFIVINKDQFAIASAIAFYVTPVIVQIIYWGDNPEFSHLKTMNILSYKIFEFYKQQNVDYVDIGPSTENSVPNYGLCKFKENIGCDISTKMSFSKIL